MSIWEPCTAGDEGRQYLIRACDLCERIVDRTEANPRDNPTLRCDALLVPGAPRWTGWAENCTPDADRFMLGRRRVSAALTVGLQRPTGRGDAGTILHGRSNVPGRKSIAFYGSSRRMREKRFGRTD